MLLFMLLDVYVSSFSVIFDVFSFVFVVVIFVVNLFFFFIMVKIVLFG